MNQTIDNNWMPAKRSTDALKKKGYSNKQLNHIRRRFIRRHDNQEIQDASTKYSSMVLASGSGHDIKYVKKQEEIDREEEREEALKNKTKGSVVPRETMTTEQAIEWIAQRQSI